VGYQTGEMGFVLETEFKLKLEMSGLSDRGNGFLLETAFNLKLEMGGISDCEK
jgi:hypothetical protein